MGTNGLRWWKRLGKCNTPSDGAEKGAEQSPKCPKGHRVTGSHTFQFSALMTGVEMDSITRCRRRLPCVYHYVLFVPTHSNNGITTTHYWLYPLNNNNNSKATTQTQNTTVSIINDERPTSNQLK